MITIDSNDRLIAERLGTAAGALSDMSELFTSIGEWVVESTKRRFPDGKGPDGAAWPAKSPVTLARQKHSDTRPLFGEGKALSTQVFATPGPDRVIWGSTLVYAAMQQFGGTRAQFPHLWGNIPARPFLGLSDEDRSEIVALVSDWLTGVTSP